MGFEKLCQSERGRESTGIPDFEPVAKEHHLNAAVAVVIAVDNGIDDGLGHNLARDFVFDRGLRTMFTGTDAKVDFGHNKVNRLIYEFEGGALVNLMGGNGLGNSGTVEVSAFDLGGQREALRAFSE